MPSCSVDIWLEQERLEQSSLISSIPKQTKLIQYSTSNQTMRFTLLINLVSYDKWRIVLMGSYYTWLCLGVIRAHIIQYCVTIFWKSIKLNPIILFNDCWPSSEADTLLLQLVLGVIPLLSLLAQHWNMKIFLLKNIYKPCYLMLVCR